MIINGGKIAELWEPWKKLSYLEGCHPHVPGGQICAMCGAAKEMGHRVLGESSIGAGGVIGPAYVPKNDGKKNSVHEGLSLEQELGEGAMVGQCSSCSVGSIGLGVVIGRLLVP